MNSKTFGKIGEMKVTLYLLERGYSVFTEYGDNSEVDLIAIKGTQTIKVQVKSGKVTKCGNITLRTHRTTPGTRDTMCKVRPHTKIIDVYALYITGEDKIIFVTFTETCGQNPVFRVYPSKNKQQKNIRNFWDFTDCERAFKLLE